MATKVEIEAAFTPSELVRWDPTLLGAVLHVKHWLHFPPNAFETILVSKEPGYNCEPAIEYMYGTSQLNNISEIRSLKFERENCTENIGVLTHGGISSIIGERLSFGKHYKCKHAIADNFTSLIHLPLMFQYHWDAGLSGRPLINVEAITHLFDLKCTDYGMTVRNTPGCGPNIILPLVNPDQFLLDQIFVASMTRIKDKDIITDLYPLSTLYQEWKRDRSRRKTDLDKAKEAFAALLTEVRQLRADKDSETAELAKHNERLRAALHVAVNPSANATATTDPI
jgi:hypothetical protein